MTKEKSSSDKKFKLAKASDSLVSEDAGSSASYSGKITTVGTSEAFRFDKSLFKQHPEFKQKAQVRADVIGPGTILVSLVERSDSETEDDPVVSAFLSFLENDLTKNPGLISAVSAEKIALSRSLTSKVTVEDDELE